MADGVEGTNPFSRARAMFAKGDFLNAIDALRAIAQPQSEEERIERDYLIVLAFARAGATRQALQAFDATLAQSADGTPCAKARDIASLRARCLKDLALESTEHRTERFRAAAEAYEAAYAKFGGYYPLINAATLRLLAGERDDARKSADRVLGELASAAADGEAYWQLATKAEALLVLGSAAEGARAVVAAAAVPNVSASDFASTKKQLRAVCRFQGIDASVLAPLRIPRPLRYCGHRNLWNADLGERHPEHERRLSLAVHGFLEAHHVGYAYGSLASGADTIIAEAVLSRGLELNLIFPFKLDDFIRISVARAGEDWVRRFESCLNRAHTVSYVLDNDYLDGDSLFVQCAAYSMGMAELRARNVASEPLQLAVWNGQAAFAAAGTASEITQWMQLGFESHVLSPEGEFAPSPPAIPDPVALNEERIRVRSYLFADVSGFSKLREAQLVPFVERFLGSLGEVIDRYKTDLRETAGDGIYLVMRDPAQAAECALEMQRRVRHFDFDAVGLPSSLNLRIAVHHGPGQVVTDPVLHIPKLMGREITRAARMEPITPLGAVYVTEQMACAIALSREANRFTCEYVGVVPSAKSFGSFRMYSLKAGGM
jgi:tetratricopeptide (TPR) repeat protein